MDNSFAYIFGEYLEPQFAAAFEGCELLRIDADRETQNIRATVKSGRLVEAALVRECAASIARRTGLRQVSFQMKYLPDLFSVGYFPSLVAELKERCGVVNGFFEEAVPEFAGGVLTVRLQNGGRDILMQAGVDRLLETIIFERFSTRVSVVFDGVVAVEEAPLPAAPVVLPPDAVQAPKPAAPKSPPRWNGGGNGG